MSEPETITAEMVYASPAYLNEVMARARRCTALEAQLAERTRDRDENSRQCADEYSARRKAEAEVQRLQGELEQAREDIAVLATPLLGASFRSRLEEATRLLGEVVRYMECSYTTAKDTLCPGFPDFTPCLYHRVRAFLRSGDAPEGGRDGE